MKRYKKLLVPIGLTNGDAGAIAYAGEVARLAGSTEVKFVHIVDLPEIPQRAKEKYPWLMDPLDEKVSEKMEEHVRAHWKGEDGVNLRYEVLTAGNEVMAILGAILAQETDLVVVSRESMGGELAIRMARKAPCSVMSVPPCETVKLERIVVPTDFSDYSQEAGDVALAFAEAKGLKEIESVHVYNIGKFSHRVVIPESEVKEMAREYAEEKHKEFLSSLDLRGIQVKPVNAFHPDVSAGILGTVRDLEADLVLTGCRGRDTVTAWLLGGNAEYLLKNARVPVVAVKPKGTGQKLLEALLSE